MKGENWYKTFFRKYYLEFLGWKKTPADTKKEVEFIIRAMNLPRGAKVLDLACGPGRHAVELANRSMDVTCVDLNSAFLKMAKELARREGVNIRTVCNDMRTLSYKSEFDAVICMFNSFGYFTSEKENMKVLRTVSRTLKPSGLFLLDLPNKSWILNQVSRKTWQKVRGTYFLEERSFDEKSGLYFNEVTVLKPKQKAEHTGSIIKLYDFPEVKKKLKMASLHTQKSFGNYDVKAPYRESSPRQIILARKSKENNKRI